MEKIPEVCRKLNNAGTKDYKWYIVGDGEEFNNLQQTIEDYHLENNIILTGRKDNPFVYVKKSDMLVMTSDFESFGMTLVESLIVGTPVITTNHIAAKEIVDEGINGYIVDMDVDSIYTKIKYIIENPQIVEELKSNCINYDASKYDGVKQFLQLIDCYKI